MNTTENADNVAFLLRQSTQLKSRTTIPTNTPTTASTSTTTPQTADSTSNALSGTISISSSGATSTSQSSREPVDWPGLHLRGVFAVEIIFEILKSSQAKTRLLGTHILHVLTVSYPSLRYHILSSPQKIFSICIYAANIYLPRSVMSVEISRDALREDVEQKILQNTISSHEREQNEQSSISKTVTNSKQSSANRGSMSKSIQFAMKDCQ